MSTPLQRREKWDRRFIDLAQLVSTWSLDPSTKCGAVIVDPLRRIVSTGYNGFPQQMPDDPDEYENRDVKYSQIVHADMNALLFARRSLDGHTIYTWPFLPCDRCFVHLAQAGITRYVAPRPVRPSHIERWGPIIEKTKTYAAKMGLTAVELDLNPTRQQIQFTGPTPAIPRDDLTCKGCQGMLWYVNGHPNTLFCTNKDCPEYLYDQSGAMQ